MIDVDPLRPPWFRPAKDLPPYDQSDVDSDALEVERFVALPKEDKTYLRIVARAQRAEATCHGVWKPNPHEWISRGVWEEVRELLPYDRAIPFGGRWFRVPTDNDDIDNDPIELRAQIQRLREATT